MRAENSLFFRFGKKGLLFLLYRELDIFQNSIPFRKAKRTSKCFRLNRWDIKPMVQQYWKYKCKYQFVVHEGKVQLQMRLKS